MYKDLSGEFVCGYQGLKGKIKGRTLTGKPERSAYFFDGLNEGGASTLLSVKINRPFHVNVAVNFLFQLIFIFPLFQITIPKNNRKIKIEIKNYLQNKH